MDIGISVKVVGGITTRKKAAKRFNIKRVSAFKALKLLCFPLSSRAGPFFFLRIHEAGKVFPLVFIVVTEEPFLVTQRRKQ